MKKIIYISLCLCLCTLSATAQNTTTVPPAQSIVAAFETQQDSTTTTISLASLMGNSSSITVTDTMVLKVYVMLDTLQDVQNIHIKVGTTSGGTDLAQYAFPLDDVTNLPTTHSYIRDGYELKLGLGQFVNPPTLYFAEVTIEDIHGNFSSAVVYQSN